MRINKLDGFRGIFSLMVVLFHYNKNFVPEYIYNQFLIRQSYMFVDFFFVLSGFVISLNYNLLNTKSDFFNYIKKRFIRLFPLLIFTVIVFNVVEILGPHLFPNQFNTPNTLSENISKSIDTIFFTNSTPLLGSSNGMNYPSWSISSEMISYLLFGLIMINFRKKMIVFSLVILSSFIFLYFTQLGLKVNGDFGFIRGFYSFFIGVFVYKSYSIYKVSFNSFHEILTLFLIIIILYLINNDVTGNLRFLGPLIFGISIFIYSKSYGIITNILEKSLFQFLGKTSYSIYLNHSLIILIFPRLIFGYFDINKTDYNFISVLILSLFITSIYSFFTYNFVELKGGNLLKKIITYSKD